MDELTFLRSRNQERKNIEELQKLKTKREYYIHKYGIN